jgi:conserved oligomeric Golgi complex subunit 4
MEQEDFGSWSIDQVVAELAAMQGRHHELNQELDSLASQREHLGHTLRTVVQSVQDDARGDVRTFEAQTATLHAKIVKTSGFALDLSTKVRELDTAQSRVQDTLARVESVIDLKTTIDSVQLAIEGGKYQEAASQLHRVLHETPPVQNDVSYEILLELEEKMQGIVLDHITNAQQQQDIAAVLSYCKLLPLLNKPFDGLRQYAKMCASQLASSLDSDGLTLRAQPYGAVIPFVDMITATLDRAKVMLKKHAAIVETQFGTGAHLCLVQELHKEIDDQLHQLLQRFIQDRKVVSTVKNVRNMLSGGSASHDGSGQSSAGHARNNSGMGMGADKFSNGMSSAGASSGNAAMDPSKLDKILEEIAYMSRESEIFDINMRNIAEKALSVLESHDQGKRLLTEIRADSQGDSLPHVTELNRIVQELIGNYIVLEEYWMKKNVEFAIETDEPVPDEVPPVSSMVDDVFYVLQQSTERAFSTCSVNSACAIVNHVNDVVARAFKEVLGSNVSRYGAQTNQLFKLLSVGVGASRANDEKGEQHMLYIALNNIEVSSENTLLLKQHMEAEFDHMFSGVDSKRMITHCLADLEHTSEQYRTMLDSALKELSAKLLQNVKSIVDSFQTVSYELSELDYADCELNDPFVSQFTSQLEQHILPFKEVFTMENYDNLTQHFLARLVRRFEKHVLKKKFTFVS